MASLPKIETRPKVSNISDADIVKKHRIYNGELSDAVIIDKKTFVRSCQSSSVQKWLKYLLMRILVCDW
jgi:predicted Ser/Thr protein kinase